MANILFADQAAHPALGQLLETAGHNWVDGASWPRERVLAELATFDALMIRSRLKIDEELLLAGQTRLKAIARWGVGLEHIDLETAARLQIAVLNSPEGSMHTVAEHSLGMMLMLMNQLGRAAQEVREGKWIRRPNTGVELRGKTVGLIGYGNMGQQTARRLSGFGCRVLTHDEYRTDYGDEFAQAVSLAELQAAADVVSLHIYAEGNHYYADAAWFAAFAKPIYFINTARGLVCNTADLAAAIEAGQVAGAALDVHEYESQSFVALNPAEQPAPFQYLLQSEKVIMTPHIAGWSFEAEQGHAETLAKKLLPILATC
ncbi:MAG: NAD(P)-dependent oxidoreductase [Bacteroidota bacterium]